MNYRYFYIPLLVVFFSLNVSSQAQEMKWSSSKKTVKEKKPLPKKKSEKVKEKKTEEKKTVVKKTEKISPVPKKIKQSAFIPIDANSLNDQAIRLAQEGKYQEAIPLFLKASKIREQQSALLFNNLAYTYELSGRKEEAVYAYRKAIHRDKNLLFPLQNLGKLLYKMGGYKEAIRVGERALKLDPQNIPVSTWLPDAYRKAAEEKILQLREDSLLSQGKSTEKKLEAKSILGIDRFTNHIETSFLLATKAQRDEAKVFLHKQKGVLTVPSKFTLNLFLWQKLQISIDSETPYLGSLNPAFVSFKQNVELVYLTKKGIFVGPGFMYSIGDLNSVSVPGKGKFLSNSATTVSDIKLGLVVGTILNGGIFSFAIYPRYLFQDGKTASGQKIAYDRVDVDLYLKRSLAPKKKDKYVHHVRSLFRVHIGEDYLTEYNITGGGNQSHYFGLYTFDFGFEFGSVPAKSKKVSVDIGFYLTANLYFLNLKNSNIRTLGRGQGFFGLDAVGAASGSAFPGYRTTSSSLTIYSTQTFIRYISLKEKIGFEIFYGNNPYSATVFFELSLGFRF